MGNEVYRPKSRPGRRLRRILTAVVLAAAVAVIALFFICQKYLVFTADGVRIDPRAASAAASATSAPAPEVSPLVVDVEVEIGPNDLRIDTYRASGAGGQHVNRTDSAVRITHIPTGLVVTSQDQRSQIQNREKAMRVLKSRLYDLQREQQEGEYADKRRVQVGTGDRSERIRTYNFPQGRVTDHRIGLTLYKIDEIMEGHLDEIIDALTLAEQTAMLNEQG
jgi:peptide chain release factor 1